MAEQALSPRGIDEFEKDSKWFYENIDSLREKKYTGKFVAIKNKEVIASDDNLKTVVINIEKLGENPSYILIEFVYPKEAVVLL